MLAYAMEGEMGTQRRAKLFRNGRSQAIRIPRAFELPGNEAILSKEGGRLIIEPVRSISLLSVLARLKPLKVSLPKLRDDPPDPVDL